MGFINLEKLKSHKYFKYFKYFWTHPKPTLIATAWGIGALILLFKPDSVVKETMVSLDENSKYKTIYNRTDNAQFDESGRLGQFYHCLKGYKHIVHKNPQGDGDGRSERVDIQIGWHTLFRLGVSQNEVYRIKIKKFNRDNSSDGSSDSYAVNCKLSLLNT